MGYKFWCESCGHNYYTVGGATWSRPGTVTVYPSYGYCGPCCGRSFTTWTWKGYSVKLECRGCTRIFGVVTAYDWKNKSGESAGYCNGCHSSYQEKERERKQEIERRERQERQMREERERKAKIAREEKRRKEELERKDRERRAKIEREERERRAEIQRQERVRRRKIEREERERRAEIQRQERERRAKIEREERERRAEIQRKERERKKQREREDQARKEREKIQQEEQAKKREKIAKQKQEAKKAASKVEEELDDLLGDSSESKQNDDEVDIKDIPSLIKDIDAGIAAAEKELQAANDLKDDIDAAAATKDVDDLLSGMENSPTIAMESEYEEIMKKIRTQRNSLSAKKQKLREREKKAAEQNIKLLDEQNKINDQMKKAKETKMELDEKRKKLETCKLDMATFGITADNVGEEELNKLNSKFEAAYSELLTKYAGNEKQIKALNECQQRMKKIRARIMADRSQCKYLVELLDAECTRLSEASDEAMTKFQQRGKYFLSVTCALPQDVVSKFIDDAGYELENILELTEQDLKDLGLKKGGVRKKVMRQIQALKQSST